MEKQPTIIGDTLVEFGAVFRWVLSGFIQAFFIVCWVLTQWAINEYVINRFALAGTDRVLLNIFQWIFAITTLAPILFFTVQFLVAMAMRTYSSIRDTVRQELDK